MSSFVKQFKARKAVALYKSANAYKSLQKGDRLWMFGSRYQIRDTSEQQSILVDEMGVRIAVPTEGLIKLLNQGLVHKDGYFKKAEEDPEGKKPLSATSGRTKEGFPLNTVRNGRIKVSMNPSRWVDYNTGHSHEDHQTDEAQSTRTKEVHAMVDKAISNVKDRIHPDDVNKLKEHFHEVLEEKVKLENLKKVATNAIKSGKTDLKNMREKVYSQQDRLDFHCNKLKQAFADSAKRVKDGK